MIEFNARFGDPETQVVLALLETPLAGLLHAAATGTLAEHPPLRWRDGAAVTVVVAAAGYPARAAHRRRDHRRRAARACIHAGTARRDADGALVSGRRPGALRARPPAPTWPRPATAAYALVDGVKLAGAHHRTDIALAAVDGRITIPC